MIVVESIEEIPQLETPLALTIGTFDGVHLGHQALFRRIKEIGHSAVLTFSNHPLEILQPEKKLHLLTTTSEKLELIKEHKIDLTLLLPFTKELAAETYDSFIKRLHKRLPFTHLILGEGDALGYNREGNLETLTSLGKKLGYQLEMLPKLEKDGLIISSGRIRSLYADEKPLEAAALLGHPLTD